MADAFLEVDGARIHYRVEGPDTAPVLMLSNSLGTDLTMWDPQIAALARGWRVLRYDTRGHGESSAPPGPYTIERLGRDVLGILDGLAIERAHFCGLSMGGMIGMWLGVNAPARIGKLALCNTAARIGPPERWNTRIEAIRANGMASIARGIMQVWFSPAFHERDPAAIDAIRRKFERIGPDGYIACCEAVRDMDQRDAIAAIRAPTLVIAGSVDGSTPPVEGRFLADRIPGARYVELTAAHLSNIEAAPRFTEALTAFLDA